MKYWVQRLVNRLGYRVQRLMPPDLPPETVATIRRVRPYTLTSVEAISELCAATEHIVRRGIPGAFVECGVWRGGSSMAVALTLLRLGEVERELFLYDTFSGMTPPTSADVRVLDGRAASDPSSMNLSEPPSPAAVRATLESTGYPAEKLQVIEGRVETTIPAAVPAQIALLRLDTDWYESTRHELEHLYPLLSRGGVLIVDDYGHWAGARQAVDEYLHGRLFLARVDYTVRLAIKE